MYCYCIHCGQQIPEISRFCKSCGKSQYVQDEPAANSIVPLVAEPEIIAQAPSSELAPVLQASTESTTSEEIISSDQATSSEANVFSSENSVLPAQSGDMGSRFVAFLIDLAVIYFIFVLLCFIGGLLGGINPNWKSVADWLPDNYVMGFYSIYFLYMTTALCCYHSTVGKYILGLEVKSSDANKSYPGVFSVLVRESLGRLSGMILWGWGYWSASRHQGQAWSDRMAHTRVVVRERKDKTLKRALVGFVLLALVADISAYCYGQYITDKKARTDAVMSQYAQENTALANAMSEMNRIENSLDGSSPEYVASLHSLLDQVDIYTQHLNTVTGLANRILNEQLYGSSIDHDQFNALLKVYAIRNKEMDILRSETNVALSMTDGTSGEGTAESVAKMDEMQSDINGLDSQADQILKDAKLE